MAARAATVLECDRVNNGYELDVSMAQFSMLCYLECQDWTFGSHHGHLVGRSARVTHHSQLHHSQLLYLLRLRAHNVIHLSAKHMHPRL